MKTKKYSIFGISFGERGWGRIQGVVGSTIVFLFLLMIYILNVQSKIILIQDGVVNYQQALNKMGLQISDRSLKQVDWMISNWNSRSVFWPNLRDKDENFAFSLTNDITAEAQTTK